MLGIDEWAWRRGRRYGTILVDLERNTVVDLLPDREAASVAAWFRAHPGVEVVARDRADVFADGVRQGAPDAVQVLDRWHLLRNLSDTLRDIVGRHHAPCRRAACYVTADMAAVAFTQRADGAVPTAAQQRQRDTRARRQARYEEVLGLHRGGGSISQISRLLGLDRKTVRVWLAHGGPPRWRQPSGRSALEPFRSQLERRWAEGCRNAAALWRELVHCGFKGRPWAVRRWATTRRRAQPDDLDRPGLAKPVWKPPSVARTVRLLQAEATTLSDLDQAYVNRLRTEAPTLGLTAELVRRLERIFRKEASESLEDWLAAAVGTALARFASGLRKDLDAVQAALALPWSTSPVEGQINRLKLIKRTMYGRAGFQLLRHRVLHTA